MLIRILTIREHKTVFFCDVCGKTARRQQLMIEKSLFPSISLQVGSVLDCECHGGISRKGGSIIVLDKINDVYVHAAFSSFKSFQETSKDAETGALLNEYSNILNGGTVMVAEMAKNGILNAIEEYLKQHDIEREYTPITTAYRGTSVASPQRAIGQYTGNRFIKITHELGLKIASYLKLKSVYEIGYVCRDRYSTQRSFNEFLSVEGVVLLNDGFILKDFFYNIWQRSIEIAEVMNLEVNPEMKDLALVDYIKEYGSIPRRDDLKECQELYDRLMVENIHMIITNAPIDTPFAYSNEDDYLPLETKWIYRGKGIGHGYVDEYRVNRVFDAFEKQKEDLIALGIETDLPLDYLNVLAAAGVPTNSFVIGVERLIHDLVSYPTP